MFRHVLFGLIMCVTSVSIMADAVNLEKTVSTRYGKLAVDKDNNLLFKGKIVQPKISGNNGLYLEKIFQIKDKDIALIYDLGGNICPASYYFVTLSNKDAQTTPSFGTCANAISFQQEKNQDITVIIPGFVAMPENVSAKKLKKIEHLRNKYTFTDGIVYLNGNKLIVNEMYIDGEKVN